MSKAAVLQERQRIACELHDGVARELAYLARNLEWLDGGPDEDGLDRLRRAVERARLESRRVISAMTAPSSQPLEGRARRSRDRGRRTLSCGTGSRSHLRHPAAGPAARTFVRIACEEVPTPPGTAAPAGWASGWNVTAPACGGVSDQGHGFDPADPGGGFGLTSMRERALRLAPSWSSLLHPATAAGWRSRFDHERRLRRVLIADDHAPSREDYSGRWSVTSGSTYAHRYRMPQGHPGCGTGATGCLPA